MTFNKFRLFLALAATVSSTGLLVAAEPEPTSPPRRPPPAGPGDPNRQPRVNSILPRPGLPVENILTPEQRVQFRDGIMAQRDKLRELDEKSTALRRELDDALFADKLDEKVVRDKGAALAELETERSLIRARAFAKVRPSLTAEQIDRLKNLRAEAGRGNRIGGPGPGGDFERPRPPRPPRQPGELDVLPPPAPEPR